MNRISLSRWRVWLVSACLLAAVPAGWRVGDVLDDLKRDRLAQAAYARGEELREAGQLVEATAAYRTALEYAPDVPLLYEQLADTQFRLSRTDDAVETYRKILKVYPFSYYPALHRGVGLIELRAGRPREARADLTQAVALDPTDWLSYFLLGHALAELRDYRGARAAWMRVLDLNPDFQPARDQLRTLNVRPRD